MIESAQWADSMKIQKNKASTEEIQKRFSMKHVLPKHCCLMTWQLKSSVRDPMNEQLAVFLAFYGNGGDLV